MFKKILRASDGSDRALKALSAAGDLSRGYGALLHMICVEEMPRFPATIDELVEDKAEADHVFGPAVTRARALAREKGVSLMAHVVAGHPVQRIVKFVEDEGCDLPVIGFMGHSALYERVIAGRPTVSSGLPRAR